MQQTHASLYLKWENLLKFHEVISLATMYFEFHKMTRHIHTMKYITSVGADVMGIKICAEKKTRPKMSWLLRPTTKYLDSRVKKWRKMIIVQKLPWLCPLETILSIHTAAVETCRAYLLSVFYERQSVEWDLTTNSNTKLTLLTTPQTRQNSIVINSLFEIRNIQIYRVYISLNAHCNLASWNSYH